MTDIVEWLRNAPSNEWCSPMLNKAADEIERLRKDVQNLNQDCTMLAADRNVTQKLDEVIERIKKLGI